MNKIMLIRHGQTDTAGKKMTGRSPGVFINDEGQRQVEKLASWLSGVPIDFIYSSPLERTFETAYAIAKNRGFAVLTGESFIEIDYGRWTNLTVEELRNDPLFKRYNDFRSNTRIPGGETMQEVQTRTVSGIEMLCGKHPGKTIAIVTHADIIKLALQWYLSIPVDMIHRLEISPSSVSILELYDEALKVTTINETSFLRN